MSGAGPSDSAARVLRDTSLHPRPRLLERSSAGAKAPVVQLKPLLHQQKSDAASRSAELAQLRKAAHADGVREGLASAVEADRQAGYDAGVQEGLERGREEAEAAVEQRLALIENENAKRAEHFSALLAAFEAQLGESLQARLREAENDMVALSHAAVCRILGAQTVPGSTTCAVVSEAITQWLGHHRDQDGGWTIHVHPRDLERLQSDASLDAMLQAHASRHIVWQADPKLAMGGCVITSQHGRLDARLDTQLAALADLLREGPAADLVRTESA